MKVEYKKGLKLVTLLITALIIATVSAQVFRYMYIDGSVTVGAAKLVWIKGSEAPSGATVVGSTVTMPIEAEPGTPQNITHCLYLNNSDTVAHNMTISVTTAVTSDFDEFKIHIYINSSSPTFVDTLDVTTSDSYETYTGNNPLSAGEAYRMSFELTPSTTASGSYDFDIQVEYE
jgi:hypothetical protein